MEEQVLHPTKIGWSPPPLVGEGFSSTLPGHNIFYRR